MATRYAFSARDVKKGQFTAEPGEVSFLRVPPDILPTPQHKTSAKEWANEVRDLADGLADKRVGGGDVLIFVHGYNNTYEEVMDRHDTLQSDLAAAGWKGVVVTFDWPCEASTLNYLEDRSDAAEVAHHLVVKGVRLLAATQAGGCEVNVHLLGHSTGAFVIMEAMARAAQDGQLFKSSWRIGQVAFIGGDVAADSLDADSDWAKPMYGRIMRLTNYQNGNDDVLAASNAKRLGTAPRSGRVGLTANAHPKAINVDCSQYFLRLNPEQQKVRIGWWPHSWHIGNPHFALDLAMTLEGRIDRNSIPTRELRNGRLHLIEGTRPPFEAKWHAQGVRFPTSSPD